jgi:hypothetical protein
MEYHPHKWLLLRITDGEPLYKVFASFYGGYLDGDSWKMNSGITGIEDCGDCFRIHGYSRSVYVCPKESYGASAYGFSVVCRFEELSEGKLVHIPTLELALDEVQHLFKDKETLCPSLPQNTKTQ